MKVDIAFDFAKVYDIQKDVDIAVGQTFHLITDGADTIQFFSNNDKVLDLEQTGADTQGITKQIGQSTIIIMDEDFRPLKKISINVVSAVSLPVSTLGLTVGNPEPK